MCVSRGIREKRASEGEREKEREGERGRERERQCSDPENRRAFISDGLPCSWGWHTVGLP